MPDSLKSVKGATCTLWIYIHVFTHAMYAQSHCTSGLCIAKSFLSGWFKQFLHCEKRLASFPSPAGMSLTTLSLGRNIDVIYKLFPARESVVSDIPAGDGNIANLFLQCLIKKESEGRNPKSMCFMTNYSSLCPKWFHLILANIFLLCMLFLPTFFFHIFSLLSFSFPYNAIYLYCIPLVSNFSILFHATFWVHSQVFQFIIFMAVIP